MATNNIPEKLILSESNLEVSAFRTLMQGFHRILWKELYYEQMSGKELEVFRSAYKHLKPILKDQLHLDI